MRPRSKPLRPQVAPSVLKVTNREPQQPEQEHLRKRQRHPIQAVAQPHLGPMRLVVRAARPQTTPVLPQVELPARSAVRSSRPRMPPRTRTASAAETLTALARTRQPEMPAPMRSPSPLIQPATAQSQIQRAYPPNRRCPHPPTKEANPPIPLRPRGHATRLVRAAVRVAAPPGWLVLPWPLAALQQAVHRRSLLNSPPLRSLRRRRSAREVGQGVQSPRSRRRSLRPVTSRVVTAARRRQFDHHRCL